MTLYDKNGRPLDFSSFVVQPGEFTRYGVVGIGRRYVGVRRVAADGTHEGEEQKLDASQLLIVKEIDGVWVTDWDTPRPKPGRRIAWGKTSLGLWCGWVNGISLFSISWGRVAGESTSYVATEFPGYTKKMWPCESQEAGEELAERLLVKLLDRLGADFSADQAVDLAPGNGFEAVVQDDSTLKVTFYGRWKDRDRAYDGEGTGKTFAEAANNAIHDAEFGEEDEDE